MLKFLFDEVELEANKSTFRNDFFIKFDVFQNYEYVAQISMTSFISKTSSSQT